MRTDEFKMIQSKMSKFHILILSVLFILYFIKLIGEQEQFGILGLVLIIVTIIFEVCNLRFKMWQKKSIVIFMLTTEIILYSNFIIYIDELYIKAVILIVFISTILRFLSYYDFMDKYVRRLLICILCIMPVMFLFIKILSTNNENYYEVFEIICLLVTIFMFILSISESIAYALNEYQTKLFAERRLTENSTEAIEGLKEQQDKLNKVNELLGVQKLKLQAAYVKMHDMAIRDGLTGVYNRRYLNQIFNDLCNEAVSQNKILSVTLFDIDHFKQINDTYGHLFGDTVIVHIANLALEIAEKNNGIMARYGGEEFVILFPEKNLAATMKIIEVIKQCISELKLKHDGKSINVNVSVGIASFNETCREPKQLLDHADVAMYYSKMNGRNRITIDSDDVRESVRMNTIK